jgi:hypothetical protein
LEGFSVVPEDVDVDDLALPQSEDASELHVRVGSLAARPTPGIADDDAVGGGDEVRDGLQRVARPSVAKLLPLAQDRLPTHRRAGLRPALGVVHDHIGVAEVAEGGHIAGVPRVIDTAYHLDVLLRHRPPSIPPLQEWSPAWS